MDEHRDYWNRQMQEPLPGLQLPGDHTRPAVPTYRGERLALQMDAELSGRIRTISRQNGVTAFMTLLAGFGLMLHRLTQQSDLIIGTPVSGRPFHGSGEMVGYGTHLLPLRMAAQPRMQFTHYLRLVRKVLLDGLDHQDYPFAELVADKRGRNATARPIVGAVFNLEPTSSLSQLPGLALRLLEPITSFTPFDLRLNIFDSSRGFLVDFDYSAEIFESDSARRILEIYQTILRTVSANPTAEMSAAPLLTDEQYRQVLVDWNDIDTRGPGEGNLAELIEMQSLRTPDSAALVHGNHSITYQALGRESNRVAAVLAEKGVGPETLVGICLRRGPGVLTAVMGILKAGGAYVPLDPSYPGERLAFMINDARLGLTLSERCLADVVPRTSAAVLYLDDIELSGCDASNQPQSSLPENLAYVIYTSGSS
ncbi:MAG: condensation domain-containing protein, partial [Blastocatellia bacterium]